METPNRFTRKDTQHRPHRQQQSHRLGFDVDRFIAVVEEAASYAQMLSTRPTASLKEILEVLVDSIENLPAAERVEIHRAALFAVLLKRQQLWREAQSRGLATDPADDPQTIQ